MIKSLQNQTVKETRKLLMKKYRNKTNQMIIEGKNLLETAKKHALIIKTFHLEPSDDYPQGECVSVQVMKHLTDSKNPPKDIAVVKIPTQKPLGQKVLFLENVQDPGNVGTLLRSALAFGFDSVVFDHSADPFSPKVLRSTQGAIFDLALGFMDLSAFKNTYPDHLIIGTNLSSNNNLSSIPHPPYALILGNEGSGLKKSSLSLLDKNINIPISTIDSLNVGVAGSIIMYELSPQQRLIKPSSKSTNT